MKPQVLSLIAVLRLKLLFFFAYQARVYKEAEASGQGTSNVELANATSALSFLQMPHTI
jgi:hypothetical protein